MPVLDGDFEAFVTNLGKYNEGMLIGEWVKLPTTEEEMQKVFERIGIGKQDEFGQPYEEWFITDYECPIYGVQKMLGEYESLDKLNYLAALIDELSLSDQEKLVAIMEAGCDEVSDIDDLINLTFNLDCYDIMPGINDESDLGYYYAHEAGIYSEKDLGPLANYIDYERYGRDIAMDEQGRFTDEGYVRVASERWDRQFNGDLDDIPDEYRITGSGEATERDSTIAVLVVEPGKEPYVKEIDSGLESLQHEVGGCIEAIYPYEDPVALVCNEEGKLEGLPLNRALRDEDGDIYDVVAGTFMVVGLTDDSFGSLTVEQMQKFSDLFKVPEQFVKLGDKIVAIPMISKEQQKQESVEQKDFEMNADTSGLTVAGHIGTWHTIDQHEVGGHSFYLMEHDTYGDEAACILTTKDKPVDRFDDPFLAEKLIAEKEGIFLWMLEGLRRLIANHYHFTISQRAKDNIASAVRDANNILDFLDSEGYVAFKADYEASTKNLYAAYKRWCEDNAENPLSPKSFANQLSQNAERYHLEPVNNLHIGGGKRCRGYMGIYVLLSPMEL